MGYFKSRKNLKVGQFSDYPNGRLPSTPASGHSNQRAIDGHYCLISGVELKRGIDKMKALRPIVLLLPVFMVPLAHGQKATNKRAQNPVETSVCKIVDDPSAYNNKLVKDVAT